MHTSAVDALLGIVLDYSDRSKLIRKLIKLTG